jgi:hypothetical protein
VSLEDPQVDLGDVRRLQDFHLRSRRLQGALGVSKRLQASLGIQEVLGTFRRP